MTAVGNLLATMAAVDLSLDAIDPAELGRAIEALETLRTLHSARRSARERQATAAMPSIPVSTLIGAPQTAREQCSTPEAERLSNAERSKANNAKIADWLRDHQPATVEDIALATGVAASSVGRFVRVRCVHDASTPWRWSLLEAPLNAE